MKLITREELLKLPTSLYDERAKKEFEEKITELNQELRKRRSQNIKSYELKINKLTDLAIEMLEDEIEKAGYQHQTVYPEPDSENDPYILVRW